jgi:hypothetical protein
MVAVSVSRSLDSPISAESWWIVKEGADLSRMTRGKPRTKSQNRRQVGDSSDWCQDTVVQASECSSISDLRVINTLCQE